MSRKIRNKEMRRKYKLLDLVFQILDYKKITVINWKGRKVVYTKVMHDYFGRSRYLGMSGEAELQQIRDEIYHCIHTDPRHFFRCLGFDPIFISHSQNIYDALFAAFIAHKICYPPLDELNAQMMTP